MITLAQLYKLGLDYNIDIFSGLKLPAYSPMSRDVLINTIMERCGLNIPVYADAPVMESAIRVWSAKNQYVFEHVGKIYTASYSPIENTDKIETIVHNKDRSLNDNTTGTRSKNISSSNTVTETKTSTHSGTDTTTETNETSAFDASTYQPESKTTVGLLHGESITDNGGGTTTGTQTTTGSTDSDKNVNENEKNVTETRLHGNIGVMDNATMQEKEYDFIKNYNPYNFITDLFENELTLFVY